MFQANDFGNLFRAFILRDLNTWILLFFFQFLNIYKAPIIEK